MVEVRRPAGRYGTPRRPRPRWLPALIGVLVLTVGAAVAVLAYRNLGPAPIEAEQAAFRVVDDGSVELIVTVRRDQPGRPADCIVRARSRDGAEVGRRELYVGPAQGQVSLRTVLHTSARATTAEPIGCSYDVPGYLLPHPS